MRKNARIAWILVGAALTLFAVLIVPVAALREIKLTEDSYDTSLLSDRTSEISTRTYMLTSPVIVVLATGSADVRVVAGQAGRLSVKRRLTYSGSRPGVTEAWDGTTLRVDVDCPPRDLPRQPVCQAEYTLGVPTDVRVQRPAA